MTARTPLGVGQARHPSDPPDRGGHGGQMGHRPGSLSLDIHLERAHFKLTARLEIAAGERVAIIGPNGAGKSTLLACLAGLLHPAGRIALDGQVISERTGGRATAVPAHRRRIGLLAQDPLLFPHLSVLGNVAYGPRSRGANRQDAAMRARRYLDWIGCAEFASLRPHQLSGGQQQRVAIARAVADEPAVLLLDEPLAALDVGLATWVRQLLSAHQRETEHTTVLCSHDVFDVLELADRLIVLSEGRVVDDGPVARVLFEPRTPFAAALSGVNVLTGTVRAGIFQADCGWQIPLPASLPFEGRARITFPPSALSAHRPETPGQPHWLAQVAGIRATPSGACLHFANPPQVTAAMPLAEAARIAPTSRTELEVWLDPTLVRCYPDRGTTGYHCD